MNSGTAIDPAAPTRRRMGRPPKAVKGELIYLPRTVCFDDELLAAIDERAASERTSRSDLVRKICHEYLRRVAKREGRVGE